MKLVQASWIINLLLCTNIYSKESTHISFLIIQIGVLLKMWQKITKKTKNLPSLTDYIIIESFNHISWGQETMLMSFLTRLFLLNLQETVVVSKGQFWAYWEIPLQWNKNWLASKTKVYRTQPHFKVISLLMGRN